LAELFLTQMAIK